MKTANLLVDLFFMIIFAAPSVWALDVEDFSEPMRFNLIGDSVDQLPPVLDYDLTNQNQLILGNTRIDASSLGFTVGSINSLFPMVANFVSAEDRKEVTLFVKWPESMLGQGLIEMIGRSGRVLWNYDIRAQDVASFKDFSSAIQARMEEQIPKSEISKISLFSYSYAHRGFAPIVSELAAKKESFRLCISQTSANGLSRFCTPFLETLKDKNSWTIRRSPEPQHPARIILFQKQAVLKATIPLKKDRAVQFLADLSDGTIVEFITKPPYTKIADMYLNKKDEIIIVGEGLPPSQKHSMRNVSRVNFLTRAFGWQETIGDFREYWETSLNKETNAYYIRGDGGGLFRQDFKIRNLPKDEIRPFLYKRTPEGTYVNGRKIYLLAAPNTKVTSVENEAVELDDNEYRWYFKAEDRGAMNLANILVDDGKNKYKAYYELYKGFPAEFSLRSSAVLGTGGNVLATGELAFNYWFENILGWSNYYLSSQRWGVSAKYFKSVVPLKIASSSKEFSSSIQNVTFDLKYRLSHGIWNRDESWGVLVASNDLTYSLFKNKQLGAGFFWGRSMPKGFDDFFNKWKIFRKPKWVDLEFIIYPVSATKNVSVDAAGNWALNFHGKVMWSKHFFGEAGFGIKSYLFNQSFTDLYTDDGTKEIKKLKFQFAALYGTVGLGYTF